MQSTRIGAIFSFSDVSHGEEQPEWHLANKRPRNASEDERIAWHLDHARNCGCRRIEGKLAELLQRRGIAIPELEQPTP